MKDENPSYYTHKICMMCDKEFITDNEKDTTCVSCCQKVYLGIDIDG